MKMRAVVWTLAIVLCIGGTHAQLTVPGGFCCGVNLMDSSDRPVIENVPLDIGTAPVTYRALRVHLCCTDRTYVQIWRRLYNEEDYPKRRYRLVWQMAVQGQVYMVTSVKYTIFQFLDNPLTLSSISGQKEYHLGIWSPGSDKHCVPYKFLQSQTRMIFPSLERYSGDSSLRADFSDGTKVEFDELDFPRTHTVSLDMCENANCNDVIEEDEEDPDYKHAVAGAPGPPGPPGPPGQASPTSNPWGPGCDIGDTMNEDIREIKNQNDGIKQEVDEVNRIVKELMQSNVVTGVCPPGFKGGSYGLGDCYYVNNTRQSYAEAVFFCADKFDAPLVNIFSLTEEVFLSRYILTTIDTDEDEIYYFLGAMYAEKSRKWYWYDGVRMVKNDFFPFLNFEDDYNKDDVEENHTLCIALTVNTKTEKSYWKPVSCMERMYSVCKVPKKCM